MNQLTQENLDYQDLLKEDKIIFTFPVLWHEWECDGTAWIMEKDDGTRYLKMTNHGGEYVAEPVELTSRINYYNSVIADTKKALEQVRVNSNRCLHNFFVS